MSDNTKPILVTGAAGQVGSVGYKIVQILREKGYTVRAMVRRIDERSEALSKLGAEVVQGDLTDLHDMHRIIKGCERIYFGMSVSPNYIEATTNVAAVAKHYGIEVLVNISQMTVSQMSITETTSSPQHKLHWLSEQVLNWSGLPVVHVRPTVFLEHPFFNQLAVHTIKTAHEIRLPLGKGKTSPVATKDIAKVVAEILVHPSPHIGKIYELTGPKSMDLNEIAQEYSSALGFPVKPVDISLEQLSDILKGFNFPEHTQNHFITMAKLHREGRYERMVNTTETITGTKATSLQDWVKENINQFK